VTTFFKRAVQTDRQTHRGYKWLQVPPFNLTVNVGNDNIVNTSKNNGVTNPNYTVELHVYHWGVNRRGTTVHHSLSSFAFHHRSFAFLISCETYIYSYTQYHYRKINSIIINLTPEAGNVTFWYMHRCFGYRTVSYTFVSIGLLIGVLTSVNISDHWLRYTCHKTHNSQYVCVCVRHFTTIFLRIILLSYHDVSQ